MPRYGPDERLIFAALAERTSRRIDAAVQRGVRDDAALPDMLNQFILADHTICVLREIEQQIEHLRLDMDRAFGAFEFAPVGVQAEIIEFYQQFSSLAVSQQKHRQI